MNARQYYRVPKGSGSGFTCNGSFNPSIAGILDTYPGANLAVSIRRLRNGYEGPCIRAGHIGDALVQEDICFKNNTLDVDQLVAFSASSSTGQGCYLKGLYRQDIDGGFIDFGDLGVSSQPLLTDSLNNPYLVGGLPSFNFGSSGAGPLPLLTIVGSTIFTVNKAKDFAPGVSYLTWQNSAGNQGGIFTGGSSVSITGKGFTAGGAIKMQGGGEDLNQNLITYLGGSEKKLYLNGTEIASAADKSYTDPYIERIGRPGLSVNGFFQEIISYPTAKTADRAAIDTAIKNYYSIT